MVSPGKIEMTIELVVRKTPLASEPYNVIGYNPKGLRDHPHTFGDYNRFFRLVHNNREILPENFFHENPEYSRVVITTRYSPGDLLTLFNGVDREGYIGCVGMGNIPEADAQRMIEELRTNPSAY